MRYSSETVAPAPEIIRLAREAFGPAGAGLPMTRLDLLRVEFRSGAGYVGLTVEPGEARNTVVVETLELDAEVRRFLARLPRRRSPGQQLRRWRSKRARRSPSARP
jgi:hypothetical protein